MGTLGRCGVGFITKDFVAFTRSTWNDGRNHSWMIYSNGYNPTSKAFNADQNKYGQNWCQDNEEIIVIINTQRMEATICNVSELKNSDDDEDISFTENVHFVKLPKDKDIALVLDFGSTKQSIHCLSQKIKYLK